MYFDACVICSKGLENMIVNTLEVATLTGQVMLSRAEKVQEVSAAMCGWHSPRYLRTKVRVGWDGVNHQCHHERKVKNATTNINQAHEGLNTYYLESGDMKWLM